MVRQEREQVGRGKESAGSEAHAAHSRAQERGQVSVEGEVEGRVRHLLLWTSNKYYISR